MAKLTTAEFIEAIKELSVLELNELVKACEEEFGVSAAAGVVVAAAKGWVELDGKWYYFDRNNGDMKRGTTIDGYTVNEDGVYVK